MKTVAALSVLMLSIITSAGADQSNRCDERSVITVNGDAVIKVKPDKVIINLGVETSNKDLGAAKQMTNDILKKALAAIRESGVPDKDIQTAELSIEPQWEDRRGREGPRGYSVRNTFVVTLIEPAKVETIITKALELGVNSIYGINFQTSELKKYREQARELALKAAKEKAEKMAAVLGQSVGAPILINEGYSRGPYYSGWRTRNYGQGAQLTQNVVQESPERSYEASETVALGMISVTANVTVTFELASPSAK